MDDQPTKSRSFSLTLSLGSAFVGIVLLTSLLLGFSTYKMVKTFARNDIRDRLHVMVGLASLQINPALHETIKTRDDESSQNYLKILKLLREVRNQSQDIRNVYTFKKNAKGEIIFIVDADNDPSEMGHVGDTYTDASPAMKAVFERPYRIQVESEFSTDKWGTWLSSFAPVVSSTGELESVLGIDMSAEKITQYEQNYLFLILMASLLITAGTVALAFFFSRRLSRPLLALASDMQSVQKFDLDNRVEVRSRILEVINMKMALDNMKKGLRSFKKYVPADLVSELISLQKEAILGTEKLEITIFFSDIENFTTICEQIPSEKLAEHLSGYFDGMTKAILASKGTVDKFIGDAIMSFWGAPRHQQDHAVLACRAALQCQQFLQSTPLFNTRIGINSGEALVGNIGYQDRLSYTALGDNVNLASRLESLNKYYGTKIIISEYTFSRIGKEFCCRPLDRVAVKGKKQGLLIYELVSECGKITPQEQRFLDDFAKGFSCYLQRRWEDALQVFMAKREEKPADRPTQILIARCEQYLKNPPPQDWDGVIVLREK